MVFYPQSDTSVRYNNIPTLFQHNMSQDLYGQGIGIFIIKFVICFFFILS